MKFGSLLKDHPDVLKQSLLYPSINFSIWDNVTIPDTFDGRSVWEAYIKFPFHQKCADSWAIVATDVLSDRYAISTVGQINLFLNPTEIVSCIGTPPHSKIDGVLSGVGLDYKDSCQGYSIYDAWEYLYENGVSETNCFSNKKLVDMDIQPPSAITYTEKNKIYGEKCKNIEGNQLNCITKKGDKPIARRSFFSNGIFNITGDTTDELIKHIKLELLRFGPVAAGFIVYENFANYDGKTVYEKADGQPLGGHYVSIIGWGKDYWICRNSWGTDWGLLGYFKMKMGIKECQLENNVSTTSPFYYYLNRTQRIVNDGLWNGKEVDVTNMKLFNPVLWSKRESFDIDHQTFYPKKALVLIKKGELYGDTEPLVLYPNELPNSKLYWAKDFKNFKFITEHFTKEESSYTIYYILGPLLFLILGYITRRSVKH